jgi:hypothetical protein
MSDRETLKESTIDNSDPWQDLVVSILSVNQYSLERTYRCVSGLREHGLFDPTKLGQWGPPDIVEKLKLAGCDRGPFMTSLFAQRLGNLGALIKSKGADRCAQVIAGTNVQAIEGLLLPVNGVGPKVLANFRLLRGNLGT